MLNPSLSNRGWRLSFSEWVHALDPTQVEAPSVQAMHLNSGGEWSLEHVLWALQVVLVTSSVLQSHAAQGAWCLLLAHEFLGYGQASPSWALYNLIYFWVWLWVQILFHTWSRGLCLCQSWTPHKIPDKWCATRVAVVNYSFCDSRTHMPQKNKQMK